MGVGKHPHPWFTEAQCSWCTAGSKTCDHMVTQWPRAEISAGGRPSRVENMMHGALGSGPMGRPQSMGSGVQVWVKAWSIKEACLAAWKRWRSQSLLQMNRRQWVESHISTAAPWEMMLRMQLSCGRWCLEAHIKLADWGLSFPTALASGVCILAYLLLLASNFWTISSRFQWHDWNLARSPDYLSGVPVPS